MEPGWDPIGDPLNLQSETYQQPDTLQTDLCSLVTLRHDFKIVSVSFDIKSRGQKYFNIVHVLQDE